jgi:D-glycero-D-manno-heptose 1,7-bisphosphate phosphatase
MKKAFFLDRDGVINKNPAEHDYVKSISELTILSDISESVKFIKDKGFLVIVISNQQGVGKGIITGQTVNDINEFVNDVMKKNGASIDAFYWCGHIEEDNCDCRKPKPGLFLNAIKDHNIDINSSYFIGDRESDRLAGEAAGIKTIIVEQDSSIFNVVRDLLK